MYVGKAHERSHKRLTREESMDERKVYHMCRNLQMSPGRARKILEQAGTEPEIVKLSRRYERGGDTDGEEHTGAVHRCVRAD